MGYYSDVDGYIKITPGAYKGRDLATDIEKALEKHEDMQEYYVSAYSEELILFSAYEMKAYNLAEDLASFASELSKLGVAAQGEIYIMGEDNPDISRITFVVEKGKKPTVKSILAKTIRFEDGHEIEISRAGQFHHGMK